MMSNERKTISSENELNRLIEKWAGYIQIHTVLSNSELGRLRQLAKVELDTSNIPARDFLQVSLIHKFTQLANAKYFGISKLSIEVERSDLLNRIAYAENTSSDQWSIQDYMLYVENSND